MNDITLDEYLKITYGIFTNHLNNANVKEDKQQVIINYVTSNNSNKSLEEIVSCIKDYFNI